MSLDNRSTTQFFRIPPDGSGKRLQASMYREISFQGATHEFQVGDYVRGVTSQNLGEVVAVYFTTGTTDGYLWLAEEDGSSGAGFTPGEDLRHANLNVATCVSSTDRYAQATQIVGKNNPNFGQYVDEQGAAYFRFAEGAPLFAPFGSMKTTDSRVVAVYEHSTSHYDELFSNQSSSGASVTWYSASSDIVLSVDSASGSYAYRTSDRNHYYLPGTGQTIMQTVACGDTGKSGNFRRWGYFDENDGIFFELSGTVLNVVLRSSTGGSPTETRVSQSSFNADTMDGDGLSGITWAADKYWVYWIDLQWLGAGRARMGVIGANGARVVAHQFENSGLNNRLYMANASLPIRYENFNDKATSGASDLRDGCATVRHEGTPDYAYWRYSELGSGLRTFSGTHLPVLSVRASATFKGRDNRTTSYPETLSAYVSGTGPVKITVGIASITALSGSSWSLSGGQGPLEGDREATSMSTATADWWPWASWYVKPGDVQNIDLPPFFEAHDSAILRRRTGEQTPWVFLAERVDPASTASVALDFTYRALY